MIIIQSSIPKLDFFQLFFSKLAKGLKKVSLLVKVKDLVDEKKMTIAELERKLDFSQGSISKWDKQSPSSERLQKVANYFSVSTDYLLGLTNVPQWATPQDVLDIERALQLNSTIVAYDGIELTDEEKEQVDAIIRGVLWKHLKNKK